MSCRTDFVVGAESGQEMTKKMARKVPHNLIYTWKISQLARNRSTHMGIMSSLNLEGSLIC